MRRKWGKPDYWDRELEERLLARLRGRDAGGPKPMVLVYTRQSVSDFDDNGEPVGPSLSQQLDNVAWTRMASTAPPASAHGRVR